MFKQKTQNLIKSSLELGFSGFMAALFAALLLLALPASSFADSGKKKDMNIFSGKVKDFNLFSKTKKIKPVIPETKSEPKPAGTFSSTKEYEITPSPLSSKSKAPHFAATGSAASSKILPPDERPQMRIDSNAPGSVSGGMEALAQGDKETAKAYAKQYVQYMTDLMHYVREWTSLVTDALYEEGKLDEDDYYRAPDLLDHALAISREENNSIFKPTHEDALRRITPDPKAELEVIYFFSLDCRYCKSMSPHFERLYQSFKNDKRVEVKAATLGATPLKWLDSYRNYTGMTMPIYQAEDLAKQLRISFVPAVVVLTKNTNQAYIKSGQQDFVRLYEFVKKSQGLDIAMDNRAKSLLNKKIGKIEKAGKGLKAKKQIFRGPSKKEDLDGVHAVSFREEEKKEEAQGKINKSTKF